MRDHDYLEPTAWDRRMEEQDRSASEPSWLESAAWDEQRNPPPKSKSMPDETIDVLTEIYEDALQAKAEREREAVRRATIRLRIVNAPQTSADRKVDSAVRFAERRGDSCARRRGWRPEMFRRAKLSCRLTA